MLADIAFMALIIAGCLLFGGLIWLCDRLAR
jgi:hypothetical protein